MSKCLKNSIMVILIGCCLFLWFSPIALSNASTLSAEDHYNKGQELINEKKYEEAVNYFEKAVEIDPNYVKAYFKIGWCEDTLKKYEEAIRDCDKAIELDLENDSAYSTRGYARASLGLFEKAFADIGKAMEINYYNEWNWYKYAIVLALKGDRKDMLQKLKKAIELEPEMIKKECKSNEEFKPYRSDPEFIKLIGS